MKLEYTYEESDFDIHSLDYDKNHGKSLGGQKHRKIKINRQPSP